MNSICQWAEVFPVVRECSGALNFLVYLAVRELQQSCFDQLSSLTLTHQAYSKPRQTTGMRETVV